MNTLHLDLGERGYDITVGRGLLSSAGEYFNLKRKTFIVTDSGVPEEYAKSIAKCASDAKIVTVPEGEGSKSPETFAMLCREMLDFGITRTDCAVAVGGGVVGDLTGFVSASFMRGIDFYNVPTTVLSQVDSSIGGKTAINLGGVKNIVGAFHQPSGVLIDLDTLKTLPKRQISNGLSEAVKMSLTSDGELFSLFEKEEITEDNIEKVIVGSLKIKKYVVEKALERLLSPCGLSAGENRGEDIYLQWDYPMTWPPLVYFAYEGAKRTGNARMAAEISNKYRRTVETCFRKTGKLWEKYDATTGKPGVSTEYETPPMLGWTAGVYLHLLSESKKPM
ncbi:MAG: iron-containing alcohol dehydrogenase [Clostridia bacterium]|nr:iron-containing alcohol dehydrogenase [Clostridia bacterium]